MWCDGTLDFLSSSIQMELPINYRFSVHYFVSLCAHPKREEKQSIYLRYIVEWTRRRRRRLRLGHGFPSVWNELSHALYLIKKLFLFRMFAWRLFIYLVPTSGTFYNSFGPLEMLPPAPSTHGHAPTAFLLAGSRREERRGEDYLGNIIRARA